MNFRVAVKYVSIFVIRLYQKTISFDHGLMKFFYPNGFCRYHPTCSEYAAQAIEKKGPFKGMLLASRRLLRCHPWAKGGYDPVK